MSNRPELLSAIHAGICEHEATTNQGIHRAAELQHTIARHLLAVGQDVVSEDNGVRERITRAIWPIASLQDSMRPDFVSQIVDRVLDVTAFPARRDAARLTWLLSPAGRNWLYDMEFKVHADNRTETLILVKLDAAIGALRNVPKQECAK